MMNKILFLGAIILVITLPLSQFYYESLILNKNVELNVKGKHEVLLDGVFMKIGDKISISVKQLDGKNSLTVNIKWFDITVASAQLSVNPTLLWISNGEAFYTIEVKPADTYIFLENIIVHYEITRRKYHVPWLFPVGLILSVFLISFGLIRSKLNDKQAKEKDKQRMFHVKLIIAWINILFKKVKNCGREILFLLVIFLIISISLRNNMLHNDEIGGGKFDGWGYFAWGYIDTTHQITSLIRKLDFSYESWQSVHNMGKPLLSNYFMAILEIFIPFHDAILASRLFVKITAALAAVAIYCLGKMMFNKIIGFLASFFLYFTPIFLHYVDSAYLDIPAAFFSVLFLIFLYKASRNLSYANVFVTGILLGLLISVKSPLFIYPFGLISFIWILLSTDLNMKNTLKGFCAVLSICLIALVVFLVHWPLMWTDPINRLDNLGMFFGIFGGRNAWSSSAPRLLFGKVVSKPSSVALFFGYLTFQTTYVELIGFIFGFVYSLIKKSDQNYKLLLLLFSICFIASAGMPGYQHEIIWLFPFWALIIGVGYEKLFICLKGFMGEPKGFQKLFSKREFLKHVPYFSIVLLSQILLIGQAAPYYGLYYNRVFLLGNEPNKIFSIPEPVYGIYEAATYLKEHSTSNSVLTMTCPHILQVYLPNFKILSGYNIKWKDDLTNMLILRSLDVEYVLIGEETVQIISHDHPLLKTLWNKAELKFTAKSNGIPLAYLFKVPSKDPLMNKLWSLSQNLENFKILANIENYTIFSRTGKIFINLTFESAYPPSLFIKLYWDVPSTEVLNLSNASIYMTFISRKNSDVTISLGLLDKSGNRVETTLRDGYLKIAERYVLFGKLSDFVWQGSSEFDFTKIVSIELILYNCSSPTSEDIIIENMDFCV